MKRQLFTFFVLLCALLLGVPAAQALVSVQGDITSDTTWGQDILLRGPVFVRSGATLTINPGVTIYGEKVTVAALITERGGKINAVGTPDKPIVFTSDQQSPKRGDWGGLILNGYATINRSGGIGEGEGDTGKFGCTGSECNDADSSGTFRYVRVEYSGTQFTPDNELNGIAFQATGSGTIVDHVQAHMTKDDCFEWFGGTTNIKYAIASACGDDSFDWTDGWRGKAQFLVVQQKGDEADNGIEADNLDKANDNLPRSNPTIYNATFIGDPGTTNGTESTHGLTLRRGTAGTLKNFIVMGFKKSGLRINNEATFKQIDAGALVFDNSIFYNNNPNWDTAVGDKAQDGSITYTYPYSVETFMTSMMKNNKESDPLLGNPYDLQNPDFRPAAGSPALTGYATPPSDGFFEPVDFIGGVDPDNDWTRAPWTTFGEASWSKPTCTDSDGDGYFAEGGNCGTKDCNDNNAAINPGAEEVCGDSIDNNCNGQTDEGCTEPGPEPCPAESLLGENNESLTVLRAYRDTVLAHSATGVLYTQLYYRFAREVNELLAADHELRAQATAILAQLIPVAAAATEGKTPAYDDALAQDMLTFLGKLQRRASIGLKIAIFKARIDIVRKHLSLS